jgi:hypothetical protein
MAPSLEEFETYERACVVTACGASPLHPRQLVHSQSPTARHSAFCAQYGAHRWPPHEGATEALAQPAFCKLKVMAIAAESCPALRPAYESMYGQMLAGVEVDVPAAAAAGEGGAPALNTSPDVAAQTPETISLNSVVLDMGLGHLAPESLQALQRAVSATYTIASCASAAYPPVHEVPNSVSQVPTPCDKHYPVDFRKEAKNAIHMYCYKLIRNATHLPPSTSTAPSGMQHISFPLAPTGTAPSGSFSNGYANGGFGVGNGGFGDESGGGDDERVRFGDILEEIIGSEDLDFEAQQELKMMAGMTMAQMDRKRKFTRPRDDMGGRIYTQADRDAMEAAITRCMKRKRVK